MESSCMIALIQVPEFSTIFFSFHTPVGRGTTLYGEIAVIRTDVSQLQFHLEKITRAVILSDSRSALAGYVSDNNPITQDVLDFRQGLTSMASLGKTIKFSHAISFYSIKNLIKEPMKAHAQEELYNRASQDLEECYSEFA
ncbi:hypothetical protein TNIN_293781 [Trichonephila inaurata madagascariensis]|uniref:Uncharacterized protein n=1 Tax=Trichonephila inaurata madagascariensis TaxID=2747483 RepID=A0A8X6YEU6_9ARAC|nr:hypothetical protein TNIN_293781 [Trichonephila inaurata madagascariensis]